MRADNTRHIVAAARNRHEQARAKAVKAIRDLDAAGTTMTFTAIARAAGVSGSWLYSQLDLRDEIDRLRTLREPTSTRPVPAGQRSSETSLRRRLEAANERNRRLAEENRQLREQLARALGELRAARLPTTPQPEGRRPDRSSATIGPC
ncbi:DUF6262 family protein [Nonomuraea endophytica]|uniref:DUF6262 family protein n=1 Tax=Nonomuraea endophytica TaxID=714136 RepID=UPI0037C96582